jgi:hypothetical protein
MALTAEMPKRECMPKFMNDFYGSDCHREPEQISAGEKLFERR